MAVMKNPQTVARHDSISQASGNSQTAQEFIDSQLLLEAEAREALPYVYQYRLADMVLYDANPFQQFDTCTRPLGALRQNLFSCLTCNPPPKDPDASYSAAAVCYSCSISCHGEHELVELFGKRHFVCDCGTTRLPSTSPCTLRVSEVTGLKGHVHSEKPAAENRYNQNFRNKFCSCSCEYNAQQERGTMFQCLALGTTETGGCGEDWYHAHCVMGLPRDWKAPVQEAESRVAPQVKPETLNPMTVQTQSTPATTTARPQTTSTPIAAQLKTTRNNDDDDDDDIPPGFPPEDLFEYFLCHKCVDSNPWIKRYAATRGFLPAVFHDQALSTGSNGNVAARLTPPDSSDLAASKKRRASSSHGDDEHITDQLGQIHKRPRADGSSDTTLQTPSRDSNELGGTMPFCSYASLPAGPTGSFSLFMQPDFRMHLCRCPTHFAQLAGHAQLLEEEANYEPPLSSAATSSRNEPGCSLGSGSLLDRGQAALSNMDRVRAIEGVMIYNQLKDKVKSFLKPFAESGTPVGADDIKRYFERLRGDADAIRLAGLKKSAQD